MLWITRILTTATVHASLETQLNKQIDSHQVKGSCVTPGKAVTLARHTSEMSEEDSCCLHTGARTREAETRVVQWPQTFALLKLQLA